MRKRFYRILITSLMIGSIFATMVSPVVAAPNLNQIKDQRDEAKEEVASLQAQLTKVINQINELEEKLIKKGEEITKATEDLKVAEEKEKKQYEDMKLRIKFMYESGDTDALEAIVESETFTDMINRAEYVQNVHTYDREQLDEYVATKKKIADLKVKLEKEQKELEATQVEFAEKQESLDATLVEKREEVANLEAEYQAAVEQAAREAEERRRREEEERRREEEAAANANRPSNNNNNNNRPSNNGSSSNKPSNNVSVGKGDTAKAQAIIAGAQRYLGVPYVWGGTSSSGVDCSGLVYLAHKAAGISVARTSGSLGAGGKAVSASEAKPGDVVCYSGHVGIYVGGGQMIHAPRPGKVVCYTNVNYRAHWFRRYW